MAAHIVHHSEMMPNHFPPKLKGHGMVSEYEAKIVMNKANPFGKAIEGGIPFEKEEDVPVPQKPRKMTSSSSLFKELLDTDPALCVTPEKQRKPFIHTQKLKGSGGEGSEKLRASQKVRFDQTVEVKHMSPKEPNLDPSPENLKEAQSNLDKPSELKTVSDSPLTITASSFSDTKSWSPDLSEEIPSKYHHKELSGSSSSDFYDFEEEPISIVSKDVSTLHLDSGSEEGYLSDSSDKEVAAILTHNYPESVIARPEFNSVLLLSEEMNLLENVRPDVIKEAEKKIKTSGKDKAKIDEKVSTKLNPSRAQFEAVIGVDVQQEEITRSVQTAGRSKAKAEPATPPKPEDQISSAPDILEFFSPDLQWETACYSSNIEPFVLPGPQTADVEHAWDVYRHSRTWEGW